MKKERNLIIILVVFLCCLFALVTVRGFFNADSTAYSVIDSIIFAVGIVFGVIIIIAITALFVCLQKNKKLFAEAVGNKSYKKYIKIFEKKANKYFLGRLIIDTKFYLVCLYFLDGQNDCGKELLLKTHWRAYENNILFLKILVCLQEENIGQAKLYLDKLQKQKNRVLALQARYLQRIVNSIEHKDYSDEFYIDSPYPIVKDIYDQYLFKAEN